MERISKTEYGLLIAKSASFRSEDPHTKVGCCIEDKDGRIISMGYNGLKEKQTLHFSAEKNRDKKRNFFIHAETNALSLIKRNEGFCMYLTHSPCPSCCQNIASHGIKKIVFLEEYDDSYKEILESYGVSCYHYKEIKNSKLKKITKE